MALPARMLTHTATIERVREVASMLGGEKKTYAPLDVGVACRFQHGLTPNDTNLGGIEVGEATGVIYFDPSTDVQRDDRVTVEGVSVVVLGALDVYDGSGAAFYRKAIVRERQQGATL